LSENRETNLLSLINPSLAHSLELINHCTVFFSYNKSANSTFQSVFSTKQIWEQAKPGEAIFKKKSLFSLSSQMGNPRLHGETVARREPLAGKAVKQLAKVNFFFFLLKPCQTFP
jgi:hypothetical protein